MRTLIYVPVIHNIADLGSLAGDVTKRGIAYLGEDMWKEHQRVIECFWDVLTDYFNSLDAAGMKIYQDGMVADGVVGEKIVEAGIKSGSRNYALVAMLIKKGATLVKTEDFNLVKEERDRLIKITQSKTRFKRLFGFVKYKLIKGRLLDKRDWFIAKKIDETLNLNEKGILFIGAYHNIEQKLSKDIQIKEIKDIKKIKEYQNLLPFCNKREERFKELGRYLVSKIEL